MDHEITTLQALSLWWQHGEIPKGFVLWGQYLFFWDRLGKILEIVGALAVVIDVLGAEQLSAIAAGLRCWSP
jgi:small-conductance mechanosensitive channel